MVARVCGDRLPQGAVCRQACCQAECRLRCRRQRRPVAPPAYCVVRHPTWPPAPRAAGRDTLQELFKRGELRGFHMDHYNRGHRWGAGVVAGWLALPLPLPPTKALRRPHSAGLHVPAETGQRQRSRCRAL